VREKMSKRLHDDGHHVKFCVQVMGEELFNVMFGLAARRLYL
jgi:hypothetical protein